MPNLGQSDPSIEKNDRLTVRNRRSPASKCGKAGVTCAVAISIGQLRIGHVTVPYSEMDWPSPFWTVLIVGLLCLEVLLWAPRRWRRKNLPRKRQLEALLKELDDQ